MKMHRMTLDKQTLTDLARRLEGMKNEFPASERDQLIALLSVGSAEVARKAREQVESPSVSDMQSADPLSGGFQGALLPLIGDEVELFGDTAQAGVGQTMTLIVINQPVGNPPPLTTTSSGGLSQGGRR